jgi:hypothetical protein
MKKVIHFRKLNKIDPIIIFIVCSITALFLFVVSLYLVIINNTQYVYTYLFIGFIFLAFGACWILAIETDNNRED